jgi:hypothetical protein
MLALLLQFWWWWFTPSILAQQPPVLGGTVTGWSWWFVFFLFFLFLVVLPLWGSCWWLLGFWLQKGFISPLWLLPGRQQHCVCVVTLPCACVLVGMHSALWAACVFHVGTCSWWISSAVWCYPFQILIFLTNFPSGFATWPNGYFCLVFVNAGINDDQGCLNLMLIKKFLKIM